MSTDNNQDIDKIICSLTDEEISMANEIYELAKNLEETLEPDQSNADLSHEWIKSMKSLDSNIKDTLSEVVKKEMAAISKIENILAKH